MVSIVKYLFEMSIVQPSQIKAATPTYKKTFADDKRQQYQQQRQNVQQRELLKNTMR